MERSCFRMSLLYTESGQFILRQPLSSCDAFILLYFFAGQHPAVSFQRYLSPFDFLPAGFHTLCDLLFVFWTDPEYLAVFHAD